MTRPGPTAEDAAGATRDLERAMLELDQLARQLHGRLDTKIARLEALLREADQRLARLEPTRPVVAPPVPRVDVTLEAQPPDPPAAPAEAIELRHDAVCQLADEGLAPPDIAQRVGRPSGEVELILALRKVRPAMI
jgi:hypothetical protein